MLAPTIHLRVMNLTKKGNAENKIEDFSTRLVNRKWSWIQERNLVWT